jgi:hypothetical protein
MDDRTGGDGGVADHAVRADLHLVTQHHLAFKDAVDVDGHVLAALHARAGRSGPDRPGARRLPSGVGLLALVAALQVGQLQRVLTPSTSASLAAWVATTAQALGHGHGDDVGQVVLALGVVVVQLDSQRRRRAVGAAIMPV